MVMPKTKLTVTSGDSAGPAAWFSNWALVELLLKVVQLASCWQRDIWSGLYSFHKTSKGYEIGGYANKVVRGKTDTKV